MNTKSTRHHYLPIFYLKGFTNEEGKFHVLDIKNQKIKQGLFSPKQVFFIWDRNTFEIANETTDFLESEIYKKLDDRDSKLFQTIVRTSRDSKIDLEDYFFLHYFISNLYWRIPRTDYQIRKIFEASNPKDLNFSIRNKITGKANDDLAKEMMKRPEFIETYRAAMSAIQFSKWNSTIDMKNWRLSYAASDNGPQICADNPIVLRNDENISIFQSELIFRLTKNITIFYTNNEIKIKEIPPEFSLKLDLVILHQSQILAASNNPDYLKMLSILIKQFDMKKTKEELFEIFD